MPTCSDIINRALRKLGRVGAGRDARPNDANDAFETLRSLYAKLINDGAFGRIYDVVPTADYVAGENERVYRRGDNVGTITLPELVPDQPGPLTPLDLSVIVIVDSEAENISTYVYDGAIKRWTEVNSLTPTDTAPLSFRDPNGLACLLATMLCDEYGLDPPAATMKYAGDFVQSLVLRYSNPSTNAVGVYV